MKRVKLLIIKERKIIMASHSGLKYVLETKKGYVKKDGSFTNKINEALLIDFLEFGFAANAEDVYKKLGFKDQEVILDEVKFHTVIPAYEARDGIGIKYYLLMGYDLEKACNQSARDYYDYKLYNDEECLKYQNDLRAKVLDYYKKCKTISQVLKMNNKELFLYETNEEKQEILGGFLKCYYSDIGSVYRYSIPLKNPHVEKYFNMNKEDLNYYNYFQQNGLKEYFLNRFNNEKFNFGLHYDTEILDIKLDNDELIIYLNDWNNWSDYKVAKAICSIIRDFYFMKEMHITRMFGSYVILQKINGELTAVKANSVPIKYCPLMIKLLKEVGGELAEKLINSLNTNDEKKQTELMCQLINQVVIKSGYFDTNRPLNSCEDNVLFGASETISSAFKSELLDAAVIVSNNLGTIITTDNSNTQGAVKRMTGLFYTTPAESIIKIAEDAGIIPVFPYTGEINQIQGVKQAINMGYKRIAVTFAAQDNEFMNQLKELESAGTIIYKFGLCSTGIGKEVAQTMLENADIVWSCASKNVKEYIEPNAIAQVGIKIPVYIMTKKGWELVKNHLEFMSNQQKLNDITLCNGDERAIILNQNNDLKLIKKKELHNCTDCPYPCI